MSSPQPPPLPPPCFQSQSPSAAATAADSVHVHACLHLHVWVGDEGSQHLPVSAAVASAAVPPALADSSEIGVSEPLPALAHGPAPPATDSGRDSPPPSPPEPLRPPPPSPYLVWYIALALICCATAVTSCVIGALTFNSSCGDSLARWLLINGTVLGAHSVTTVGQQLTATRLPLLSLVFGLIEWPFTYALVVDIAMGSLVVWTCEGCGTAWLCISCKVLLIAAYLWSILTLWLHVKTGRWRFFVCSKQ